MSLQERRGEFIHCQEAFVIQRPLKKHSGLRANRRISAVDSPIAEVSQGGNVSRGIESRGGGNNGSFLNSTPRSHFPSVSVAPQGLRHQEQVLLYYTQDTYTILVLSRGERSNNSGRRREKQQEAFPGTRLLRQ